MSTGGPTNGYVTGQCHEGGHFAIKRATDTYVAHPNHSGQQIQEPLRSFRGSAFTERGHRGQIGLYTSGRFVCSQCSCTFTRRGGLTEHVKHIHQKLARYQCEHCRKGYSHRSHYLDHLATHTGAKRNVCTICQKEFTFKCNLTRHISHFH